MAGIHHADAQLLTGHQQWRNVPTDQREKEAHTVGLQHGCHVLPTMPDACRVHLGQERGGVRLSRTKVQAPGQVGRGITPLPQEGGEGKVGRQGKLGVALLLFSH